MRLTEFLEARIAEDEEQAESCNFLGWFPAKKYGVTTVSHARVLAECAAKRAIMQLHAECEREGYDNAEGYLLDALGDMAAVYKDHTDYQQEWAL